MTGLRPDAGGTSAVPGGVRLFVGRMASPLGVLLLVHDEVGRLRALDFHDFEARMHLLLRRHYGSPALTDGPVQAAIAAALTGYFEGDHAALADIPTETAGTAFQRSVWGALRAIPPGETRSYGALAAQLGRPGAARAVGLANGANPIAIVVPCHRVIGADGALTGFGGGLHRKRWLLDHERKLG